jgi:uncharacterized protein with HEPN domain
MCDKEVVLSILGQIDAALETIKIRTTPIKSPSDFTGSPDGMFVLDGVCMLFVAIGESIKNLDKITDRAFLICYPEIDWSGVTGFRDIIAHHYFDLDADQVFVICTRHLEPLQRVIRRMIADTSP